MRRGTPPAVALMLVAVFLAVPTGQVLAGGPPGDTLNGAVQEAVQSATGLPGNLGWVSSNWAGYALASGPYRSVSGQWKVPTVSASGRPGFSALWVGVDGFNHSSLIQAGTEADFYNGVAHYFAWWEILPEPEVTIHTLPVRAGDLVTVTIARVSSGQWRITIKDARSGTFSTTRRYSGPGTSAEWIEEAPAVGGRSTPLAVHKTVVVDNATVNGKSPGLSLSDGGAMIRRGIVVETPSAPDSDGNGFALAQQATPPARPAT